LSADRLPGAVVSNLIAFWTERDPELGLTNIPLHDTAWVSSRLCGAGW
jgi:hypothetical protein